LSSDCRRWHRQTFAARAVFSGSLSTAFAARLVPMCVAVYQRAHAVELVSRVA
jgi:hypothetical protein